MSEQSMMPPGWHEDGLGNGFMFGYPCTATRAWVVFEHYTGLSRDKYEAMERAVKFVRKFMDGFGWAEMDAESKTILAMYGDSDG